MKKTIFSIGCVIFFLAVFASCEKLDVKAPDRFTEESVWKDHATVQAYINSKYRDLVWGFYYDGVWQQPLWSAFSDECFDQYGFSVKLMSNQISSSTGDPYIPGYGTNWAKNYKYIRDCNLFFGKINTVPNLSTVTKAKMVGEMHFIRAFRYFDLLRNYGGVPIITKVYAIGDDFKVTRNTVEETFSYIISEIDSAVTNLPSSYSDDQYGRATIDVALALKSRVLLYQASEYWNTNGDQSKWTLAANAAKVIIDEGTYTLDPDYKGLFLTDKNSEVIFSRLAKAQSGITGNYFYPELYCGPNGYMGQGGNNPTQNLVDDYEMANGKMISESGSGYDPQNPYIGRDPRFYASILYNGAEYHGRQVEVFMPGGVDTPDGPNPSGASVTGYSLRKFMKENIEIKNDPNAGSQPFVIFRLAEIYLNYAEALNESQGPVADVYTYLNLIRQRAVIPDMPAGLSKEQMRDRIRHERRIELAFEEHRYYDVRRWKIADQIESNDIMGVYVTKDDAGLHYDFSRVTLQRVWDARQYLFPIPKGELQINPDLVQNPGYLAND